LKIINLVIVNQQLKINKMKNKSRLKKQDIHQLPDTLLYPPNEDIYVQFDKEIEIDPEDISKNKTAVEINNHTEFNQKDFEEDVSGSDLDIPGSEFDDELEQLGNEDEENNHYSIGGDAHSNLEESTGDNS
jgi:hypothetical protein